MRFNCGAVVKVVRWSLAIGNVVASNDTNYLGSIAGEERSSNVQCYDGGGGLVKLYGIHGWNLHQVFSLLDKHQWSEHLNNAL